MYWGARAFAIVLKATVLVHQGSPLRPILFARYIKNLPEGVNCGTYLFVDDTKTFQKITTKEDAIQLQADINSLEQW